MYNYKRLCWSVTASVRVQVFVFECECFCACASVCVGVWVLVFFYVLLKEGKRGEAGNKKKRHEISKGIDKKTKQN